MSKILLPYAYDENKELIHIDNVKKDGMYTCPCCGANLSLRISKIPKGQKYHRRNHFAHKTQNDNNCSESFLHKLFKENVYNYIKSKILNKEDLNFEWQCEKCTDRHTGNLLKKAVNVDLEHNLGGCKPDIALLDKNNKVVIVVEIVVTHKPEDFVLKYYEDNRIACLQLFVDDFDDCNNVEYKLSHPDKVNLCPNPICKICGRYKQKAKIEIIGTECWRCGRPMKIAMMVSENEQYILHPTSFTQREIELANLLGANIKENYSKTQSRSYKANTCKYCNAFMGDFHLHDYYYLAPEKESEHVYKCFYCEKIKR